MNGFFVVTWAHGNDRDAGKALIRQKYRRHYGVEPEIPDSFLVALLEGRVAATIVVETVERAMMPLTVLYDIPPGSLSETKMAQWSRFTADAPFARAAICCGAAAYSLRIRRRGVLLEAKPFPIRRHASDGIEFDVVPGTRLLAQRAHPSARLYYETPPPPILYRADAAHVLSVYRNVIARSGGNVLLDL